MRIPRLAATTAAAVTCTLLSVPTGATVAVAAAPATALPAATGRMVQVTLALTPRDRGALRHLALATPVHGPRAGRLAALRRALPSARQHDAVAAAARALGLAVTRRDTLSMTVQAPVSRVDALFGSARAVAQRSHVAHPLPRIPAALQPYVTVALGGDDRRPALRHQALLSGTDARTLYGDTGKDPLDPSAAERDVTVATLQLSSWQSSDLDGYRSYLQGRETSGRTWPRPRYTQVNDPALPARYSADGSFEVALDQEALYAVAPYAHQRAYLSRNSLGGLYDSLGNLGDDASDPRADRHIVAASTSWAFCESEFVNDPNAGALFASMEDAVSYVVASGVTLFAASGDGGGYCDVGHERKNGGYTDPVPGVAYPASSPQVVAVGGTQRQGKIADEPRGWVDANWDKVHPAASPRYGAAGGGQSIFFPQPSYQAAAVPGADFRTVPDIAGVAGGDQGPGFGVWYGGGLSGPISGTSLASPVMAATYAVQVAATGYRWGVGNILPGLYGADTSAPSGPVFTDVNDGCTDSDPTLCGGWTGVDVARPGYDEVTGLGEPHWDALLATGIGGDPHLTVATAYSRKLAVGVTGRVPSWQHYSGYRVDVDGSHVCVVNGLRSQPPSSVRVPGSGHAADGVHQLTLVAYDDTARACHFADGFVFIDTVAPRPTAHLQLTNAGRKVTARWGGSDGGSGIASYDVRLADNGHALPLRHTSRSGTWSIAARRGHRYTLTVTATDRAGNRHSTGTALSA